MKYQYLMADQTLFRDRDVFEIDHIPDQFEYREAQLRELAFSLGPGLHGSRPLNTILRGLPGTGKTTSVHRIFSEIDETTKRLVPVYVNCQNERSRFSVFAKIHLKLFGHLPPPTGISFGKILHDICKGMIERNSSSWSALMMPTIFSLIRFSTILSIRSFVSMKSTLEPGQASLLH